jgi:hypothetical protein
MLMNNIDLRRFVASFGAVAFLLLQISPARAGAPQADRAVAQGARLPGLPVHGTGAARKKDPAPVEVTFTKWITTGFHMAGETGGDVPGVFGGEVLQRIVSTNPNITQIIALEAVYEVQADNSHHSFTALLRGGQTGDTAEELGSAILKGVILAGWRIGAQVRVEFQKISSCAGKPAGPCFQGTMYIEAAKK